MDIRIGGRVSGRPVRVGRRAVVLLLAWLGLGGVSAGDGKPDLAREQRMAQELADMIFDGEAVDLVTADGQVFLAIHTESSALPARGTVIILHGRGFHPDWFDVVNPLRVGLTASGWNTLAIQLPVLNKTATYYDYFEIFPAAAARIDAALTYASMIEPGPIVILAHSCGSHMAQHWVLRNGGAAVARFDAFIGIGMGATDYRQTMREPFALDKMTLPVLDVYAEHDFPAVMRLAPDRLAAIKRGADAKSAQRIVADADHYYIDRGDRLLEVVVAWLDTL